ncbi:hypothetical protein V2J09_004109 [Rumex salicifolius]
MIRLDQIGLLIVHCFAATPQALIPLILCGRSSPAVTVRPLSATAARCRPSLTHHRRASLSLRPKNKTSSAIMSCFYHLLSSRLAFNLHRRLVGVPTCPVSPPWRRIVNLSVVVNRIDLESAFARLRIHYYSSSSSSSTTTTSPAPAPKRKSQSRKSQAIMDEDKEKDAFYVVRKGDVVGVYKTLSDCQAQVSGSICDPPVSAYKGYSLSKDTEDYLLSRGLQNALYTLKASDLKEDLFGTLLPCSFQEPSPLTGEVMKIDLSQKRPQEAPVSETVIDRSVSVERDPGGMQVKLDHRSCILEFDGASKGNPGQAGAGVVLRDGDGNLVQNEMLICKLHQGLGVATCNAAEYRAVILGLKSALERGYTSIRVQGDSKLVCMQLKGLWKVRDENMSKLHAEAKELKRKFSSFEISHVLRTLNSEADAQANLAIKLADGQIEQDLLCHTHQPLK